MEKEKFSIQSWLKFNYYTISIVCHSSPSICENFLSSLTCIASTTRGEPKQCWGNLDDFFVCAFAVVQQHAEAENEFLIKFFLLSDMEIFLIPFQRGNFFADHAEKITFDVKCIFCIKKFSSGIKINFFHHAPGLYLCNS